MRPSLNSGNAGGVRRPAGGNGGKAGQDQTGPTAPTSSVLLRPHVYSYTCRGALHMESGPNATPTNADGTINTKSAKNSGDSNNEQQPLPEEGLPLCRGLATKLRHVAALPAARTAGEAVRMFQQVLPATRVVASNDEGAYDRASSGGGGIGGGGGHHHDHHSATPTRGYDPASSSGGGGGNAGQPTHSVACYGSTDVHVLTVEEVETAPAGAAAGAGGASPQRQRRRRQTQQQQQQQNEEEGRDPLEELLPTAFGPKGIFGPFGGFGGSGAGAASAAPSASSRSVSQSTRVVNGQTITTREAVAVDADGRRRVERETTIRNHRDGSVEVIKDDGSGTGAGPSAGSSDNSEGQSPGQGSAGKGEENQQQQQQQQQHTGHQVLPPSFFGGSPFGPPHRIVRQSEPRVVAVVPECKLGVTVSSVETATEGDTIASFRVGPVELAVGDSYDIVEEEGGDGGRSRQYGDGAAVDNDGGGGGGGADRRKKKKEWNVDEIEAKLLSTMDKTASSMKRNAEMLSDAVAEDFPSRMLKGGERVVGSFDKTFDRMTKLATDLYGWASGDGGRK